MLPLLKANCMHPVDAYEFLHRHSQQEVEKAATAANNIIGTDYFARLCGQMVSASLDAEDFRRAFMPFMPRVSHSVVKSYNDQMVQLTAQNWNVYLDAVRGENSTKTEKRVETWKRVLNTRYPIAQTQNEVVWEKGVVKLLRYAAVAGVKRKGDPLLLNFAIMNTPWVFDLYPGNSFVEYMIARGHDVFLIDWGTPTTAEKDWTLGTYALQHLPEIVEEVKRLSGSNTFNMLGWCLGALIASFYASLRPKDGIKKLVLLTAPLDFSDENLVFTKWLRHIPVKRLLAQNGGMMPAHMIDAGAMMLKPIDNGIRKYLAMWSRIDDPKFLEGWWALNTWVEMIVPICGGAYEQVVFNMYLGNEFTAGTFMLGNENPNLATIEADVLGIIAEADHITPPSQMERAFPLIGSKKKKLIRIPGAGHIGVMVGGGAQSKTWPEIERHLSN